MSCVHGFGLIRMHTLVSTRLSCMNSLSECMGLEPCFARKQAMLTRDGGSAAPYRPPAVRRAAV